VLGDMCLAISRHRVTLECENYFKGVNYEKQKFLPNNGHGRIIIAFF
jgi:hypothetical protein